MTIETLKSPNPRNRNNISVIKSKFLSVSSMNTLLAILKVPDARRDVHDTGRRIVPQISLETPPPPPPGSTQYFRFFHSKHFGHKSNVHLANSKCFLSTHKTDNKRGFKTTTFKH